TLKLCKTLWLPAMAMTAAQRLNDTRSSDENAYETVCSARSPTEPLAAVPLPNSRTREDAPPTAANSEERPAVRTGVAALPVIATALQFQPVTFDSTLGLVDRFRATSTGSPNSSALGYLARLYGMSWMTVASVGADETTRGSENTNGVSQANTNWTV